MSQIILFIVSFIILAWASKILVSSLTEMAGFLRISRYALSFIIMGLATSIPELFIAISSSIEGMGELSLGNILGSNILNITLLIGVIAVIAGGIKSGKEIRKEIPIILAIAVLPFLLAIDGHLDWLDGLALVSAYFLYLSQIFKERQKISGTAATLNNSIYSVKIFRRVFIFLGALGMLLIASFLITNATKNITETLNIGLVFFGIFIVSAGTTIPELVFGVRSVMLKHDEMTLGTAFGSLAANSTLVLGLASIISPIKVVFNRGLIFPILFLLGGILFLRLFLRGNKFIITKKEGLALIFLYIIFLIVSKIII